jgi:hypothetical protein
MLLRSLKILVYWFGRCNVYPSNVSGRLLFPVHIKDNDMHITFTSVASLIYNVFHTHTHQNIRNSGCRQSNPPEFRNRIPRIPFPASSWERSLWQKAYPSPQKYGWRVQPHTSIHRPHHKPWTVTSTVTVWDDLTLKLGTCTNYLALSFHGQPNHQ